MHALYEGDVDLAVGDGDDDRGRLLPVLASRDRVPGLAGSALADHAQRRRGGQSRARQTDPLLPRAPRPLARSDRRRWAAHVAGAIGVSTDAQASWWGGRGVGTVPHGLIAAYGGDTVKAAQVFAERFHEEMNITVLVTSRTIPHVPRSRSRDGARTKALGRAARHLGADGRPVAARLDGRLRPARRQPAARAERPNGARRGRFSEVRIVASGGFTVEKIEHFEALGVPVDTYGVGSSLIRGQNDFTAEW